jgi:hypothetical protein
MWDKMPFADFVNIHDLIPTATKRDNNSHTSFKPSPTQVSSKNLMRYFSWSFDDHMYDKFNWHIEEWKKGSPALASPASLFRFRQLAFPHDMLSRKTLEC